MPHLLIVKGPRAGEQFDLDRDRTVLGREQDCSVVLESSDSGKKNVVSRKHALIVRRNDEFHLEDGDGNGQPSRNHTYVNGDLVPFGERVLLKNNDAIKICDYTFAFHESAPATPPIDGSVSHDSSNLFLSQPAEKVKLLLEISNRLSNTLELDTLLPQVVETLLQLFKQADRGFLIFVDEASGALIPHCVKTCRAEDETPPVFSTSIVKECLRTLKAIYTNNPQNEFPGSSSVLGLALHSVMCAPLWSQGNKAFGVLLLDSHHAKKKFTQEDLNLLMGVASQASIALANARYHRDALVRERINRDLVLARQVVKSFLPANLPEMAGYEFFAFNESAHEVGGDYYDLIQRADRRLGILLGDVAGKGVAAALVMARFSAEARACLRTEVQLADAVRQFNSLVQPLNLTDRFVTLSALLHDPATHTVAVVNAGHPPPLLLRQATGTLEEVASTASDGPPLGVLDGFAYEAHEVCLQPGDVLVLFSDGVTEAMNLAGHQLGPKGLRSILQRGSVPPRQLGERILQAVKDHAAGCSQHDDMTLVCFGRTT